MKGGYLMPDTYNLEMKKLYDDLMKSNSSEGQQPRLPIICPGTYEKPCRLCDLCKTILFKRDNEGTPIRQKATDLNRKKSYYSNVIFPTNPSEIVVFQYGDTIWKDLMLFLMSPTSEIQDFLDPRKGRNIVITKTIDGGNKRRTKYSTKPRINPSPLLDMSVLSRLKEEQYQLHNIIELIKLSKVKPFYQSILQERETELRFLPSWLGPGISKFFQLVMYHYSISEEEFDLVQRGEYDPFSGTEQKKEVDYTAPKLIPSPAKKEAEKPPQTKSMWGEYLEEASPPRSVAKEIEEPKKETEVENYPPCFGKQYSPTDEECNGDCKGDGWMEACKSAQEASERASFEKRKIAKRLVK